MTTKLWAELRDTGGQCSLSLMQGTISGVDDNDDDIVEDIFTVSHVPLLDDEDQTWIGALAGLGYKPLTDTVSFTDNTITFLVANK